MLLSMFSVKRFKYLFKQVLQALAPMPATMEQSTPSCSMLQVRSLLLKQAHDLEEKKHNTRYKLTLSIDYHMREAKTNVAQ